LIINRHCKRKMLASGIAVRRSLGGLAQDEAGEFIICLAGIAAIGPLSTNAAGEKIWRVGLLSNSPPPSGMTGHWRDEILRVLAQNGFAAGRNLEMIERYSEGDTDRLPQLAREINASGIDAIVALSLESVRAALSATQTTPVVMVVGYDPVKTGLVASFAHPGGRVTGIVFWTAEGDAKRLELLREAIPGARFGYLGMSFESATKGEEMARAAARLGVELTTHWVGGPDEYAAAFTAMRNEGVAGVVVSANQPLSTNASRVAASAAESRLPTICEWDFMARVGCALGFGHDLTYAQRRVGEYVARILKGTAPSELPVEQSDAWKLTVNLRVATQLGITLSPAILARADEVIE
jgi:putative tryptophan/tyrosine transport system substrate-binding protein